jgi:hypothetical protein
MKAQELRKQADRYNRKKFRKNAIKFIKNIRKLIKRDAKAGKHYTEFSVNEQKRFSWEMMVGLRWFRRHGGLESDWNEENDISGTGKKYIDKIYGSFKW